MALVRPIPGGTMISDALATEQPSFPVPRECPFAPPAVYGQWRDTQAPVLVSLPNGSDAWVLTRHEDVRLVLAGQDVTTKPSDQPRLRAGVVMAGKDTSLLYMDEPEHGHYRRMFAREFGARHITAMRPGIEAIANQCIDQMLAAGSSADLVEAFCLPVPSMVMCQLLGVPYDRNEYFAHLATQLTDRTTPADVYGAVLTELNGYMDEVVSEKELAPSDDDILGRLIISKVRTGELRHDQLVGFAMLLLIAGYETTANQIAMGVLNLLTDRPRLEAVQNEPGAWAGMIEEMLRVDSISDSIPVRTAVKDFEVGGQRIAAGDGVIALLSAANHDPQVFDSPCAFDPERDNRRSVAFGIGTHSCVGQNLARAELDVAFRQLFTRIPTLVLAAPVDDINFKHDQIVFGPERVDVTW
ncbi:cytochrome P450 [Mycolicibacterium sp. P9-22]|uniref:cytochrome P450 n=1 Tax=Mycolicibacterium sp. P9-22 TaxID=2024613 RepID=UPI001883E040|nr:cytochrome P450 [Mycolicibacterium sp. P9-22]